MEPKRTLIEVLQPQWWIGMLSFGVSMTATPIFRWIAYRRRVVDQPDELLKPHGRPTAYLGGVAIYGGYAGYGEPDPDERNLEAYETTLSGDIGTQGDNADNSYHVVTGSGTDGTAVLDGLTITAGNADGSHPHDDGGGVSCIQGSPTLIRCTITGNEAWWDGGGMYNETSHPIVSDCTFDANSTGLLGGGIYNRLGDCFSFTGPFLPQVDLPFEQGFLPDHSGLIS